jgi:hypothetical protein
VWKVEAQTVVMQKRSPTCLCVYLFEDAVEQSLAGNETPTLVSAMTPSDEGDRWKPVT